MKRSQLLKIAQEFKSVEDFHRYLWSGHSFSDVQDRFRAITGESKYVGSKIGIKTGVAQGESFAEAPTTEKVIDFFNEGRANK